jgi:hypothetical protein
MIIEDSQEADEGTEHKESATVPDASRGGW